MNKVFPTKKEAEQLRNQILTALQDLPKLVEALRECDLERIDQTSKNQKLLKENNQLLRFREKLEKILRDRMNGGSDEEVTQELKQLIKGDKT